MKLENKSISQLKKDADKFFSLFIRKRDEYCYTCNSGKNIQAGHFVSRSHNSLRYSEVNVRGQCVSCNVFKHGNSAIFAANLLEELGEKEFQKLVQEGEQIKQFTKKELISIIERYK